jgi:hypothetical protein
MTPREFLESIVRPNVDEFHIHYADMRHAHNAVSAVDALAAHLYDWAKQNNVLATISSRDDSHYKGELAKRNPDFALLRDIANAQKHVHLTRRTPQVTLADQIVSRPIGWGEGPYGLGRYGGVQQVVVDIRPGDFAYLENTIDNALAFLEAEMASLGCK